MIWIWLSDELIGERTVLLFDHMTIILKAAFIDRIKGNISDYHMTVT
ncbi:MAG: hypothetical protein Q8K40_04855 [Ignavibacteria bacterium]|nr:hypothetical protein [Ignavibacteria bacterium]